MKRQAIVRSIVDEDHLLVYVGLWKCDVFNSFQEHIRVHKPKQQRQYAFTRSDTFLHFVERSKWNEVLPI